MQTQIIEKWSELCKCASKPLIDIAELNLNTWNELTKHVKFDEFKSPSELLNAQSKIANEAIKSAGDYANKIGEIWQDAAVQASKTFNDIVHEAVNKASSVE